MIVALLCTGAAALVNWSTRVRPRPLVEMISKPLTTVLVTWVAIAANGPHAATVLAVVGLVCCLAGDIALLDAVDQFVVGLAAFLVGHAVFIAMFVALHLRHPRWAVPVALALVIHAATIGRRIVRGAVAQEAALRIPVIAYLLVITSMAVVATATGRWWAVAGALLFVGSDTILGWRAFVDEKRWMSPLVMITYHAALVGLALSLR